MGALTYVRAIAWKLAYVLRGWADISLLKTVSHIAFFGTVEALIKRPSVRVRASKVRCRPDQLRPAMGVSLLVRKGESQGQG